MEHADETTNHQREPFPRTRLGTFWLLVTAIAASVVMHGPEAEHALLLAIAVRLLLPGHAAALVREILERWPRGG